MNCRKKLCSESEDHRVRRMAAMPAHSAVRLISVWLRCGEGLRGSALR